MRDCCRGVESRAIAADLVAKREVFRMWARMCLVCVYVGVKRGGGDFEGRRGGVAWVKGRLRQAISPTAGNGGQAGGCSLLLSVLAFSFYLARGSIDEWSEV